MTYVILYLAAIVLANLSVAFFGPTVAVVNAFLFIGLDLTARDRLHQAWRNNKLLAKMAALIGAGAMLSYLLNREAGPIALASFLAFASAATVDSLVYHGLSQKPAWVRINGSNIPSAAVDSFVFIGVAFGVSENLNIIFGQIAAKILGGFCWAVIFSKWER